jgi:hypothetical protein
MPGIPERLAPYSRFIKLESESKAPKVSPEGPFYDAGDDELIRWIEDGGNVGLNLGELVVLDVDHDEFRQVAHDHLPNTFTVRSGGGGEHWYYRSDWEGRRQFTDGETDFGSVRSGNWYVVIPPSVHPDTGNEYSVLRNSEVQPVPKIQVEDFLTEISERTNSQHSGGGGGGGGCVGSSSIPEIPSDYPQRDAKWPTLQSWLSANGMVKSLNRTSSSDWSGLEFKVAKCLAEGGFSEASISDVLDRLSHNAKWHSRGSEYQQRTVRNAIVAAVNDPHVEFSQTGDMDLYRSESRKTEESDMGRTLEGGENNMPEFTDKLSVPVLEGSEDGDSFKKISLVEGRDGDETFEYLALKKGRVQEVQTTDGETVLAESVSDSVSLGSPDYIDGLVEGLEEMQEQLDD